MKRILIMGLIVAAMSVQSLADGKMFWPEDIPPEIPYQRALILFGDGIETLVLQSKYEIPETNNKTTIGWIVPVPAVPEVASMPAYGASELFLYLSMNSQPLVTRIWSFIFDLIMLTIAGLSLLTLLLGLLSFVIPFPPSFVKRRLKLCEWAVVGLFCFLIAGFISLLFITAGTHMGESSGVDLIAEHRVGVYDVRVVRSDDSGELISWLNANKFKFAEKDTAAFDSYISKGWCFVVAVINPAKDRSEHAIASEGLAAPLILRFPNANPVYPLALTGTGGFETEVLIYLASQTKMSCDDQLTLRFAGHMHSHSLRNLSLLTKPKEFFNLKDDAYPYLCKFKGRLSPGEMSKDIIFSPAKDNDPYREHIWRW